MESLNLVSEPYNHLLESDKWISILNYFFPFQVYFLYQYSLQFFLDMYLSVLHENPNLNNLKDSMSRLNVITTDVFQVFTFDHI
jgi:hypothetical protein